MNKETDGWLYTILLVFWCIVIIVGAVYLGVYIMLFKGIIMLIHGICTHPIKASKIASGCVRIIFAFPVIKIIGRIFGTSLLKRVRQELNKQKNNA